MPDDSVFKDHFPVCQKVGLRGGLEKRVVCRRMCLLVVGAGGGKRHRARGEARGRARVAELLLPSVSSSPGPVAGAFQSNREDAASLLNHIHVISTLC